jgi:hypothetical protein
MDRRRVCGRLHLLLPITAFGVFVLVTAAVLRRSIAADRSSKIERAGLF